MSSETALPAAAWYPDPHGHSELRWWDGTQWTDAVHPPVTVPAGATPAAAQASQVHAAPSHAAPAHVSESSEAPAKTSTGRHAAPYVEETVLAETAAAASPTASPAVSPAVSPAASPPPTPASAETIQVTEIPAGTAVPGSAVHAPAASAFAPAIEPAGAGTATATSTSPVATDRITPLTTQPLGLPSTTGVLSPDQEQGTYQWDRESRLYETAPGAPTKLGIAPRILPTRTSTGAAWVMALTPLIASTLFASGLTLLAVVPTLRSAGITLGMLAIAIAVAVYLLTIVLAMADHRRLDHFGHEERAHWSWAALTPLGYLIVRTIAVHRETGRATAPLWVLLLLSAGLAIAIVYGTPLFTAAFPGLV